MGRRGRAVAGAVDGEEGHLNFAMDRFALYCSGTVYDEGSFPVFGRGKGFFAWNGLQVKVKDVFKSTVSSCGEVFRLTDCLGHFRKYRRTTTLG